MRSIVAAAVVGTFLALLPAADVAAQAAEYETTQIGDGIYQFRFRSHNGFFVVTDQGIVAFDPISVAAAERYAAEMKRVAPGKKLLAVVYSHDHADHATGAGVLQDAFSVEVLIIAHENARSKLVNGDAALPPPTVTFTDQMTLHFGGRTIELHYLGKSHSDNMIVALLPRERIAFAVDFVSNDRVGYRDLPDYHFPDFFNALERLLMLDFDTIVFGHGPPGDKAAVQRQARYYGSLRAAVTEAIERGWSEDEAAERVRLPMYEEWGRYDDWIPMNVRAIYRWLESARR